MCNSMHDIFYVSEFSFFWGLGTNAQAFLFACSNKVLFVRKSIQRSNFCAALKIGVYEPIIRN